MFIGRLSNQVAYRISHLKYLNAWLIWYLSFFPPIKNWHLNTWVSVLFKTLHFNKVLQANKFSTQMFYDFLYTTTVMGLCASELRMVCVPLSENQGPKDVHPKLSLLCLLLTVPDEILLNEASAQFSCAFSKKKPNLWNMIRMEKEWNHLSQLTHN